MKKNSYTLTMLLVSGLLFLSGCASYKVRPLICTPQVSKENQGVEICCKVFDKKDCKLYLDRNVIKYGYRPIYLSITNKTGHKLHFTPDSLDLPTVDADVVAQRVYTNTMGRVVGYGLSSLVIWPLVIPAIVDGIGSSKANKKLQEDFHRKILRDQWISPYETIHGLVFVPKKYFNDEFQVTLFKESGHFPITTQVKICA